MPNRRTTNAEKALKGTLRKDRLRTLPKYSTPAVVPSAPGWLTDPVAVAEFDARARDLYEAGVLTDASLTTLAHYAAHHGAIVAMYRSGERPNASDLTQLRMMATEFGFTPASRSKALDGVPSGEAENEFEAFKAKKGIGA